MKVLYVNHTGEMSGAERSLIQLLDGLPREVSPTVACPNGPLATALESRGVSVARIPSIHGSLRLHPRHTLPSIASISYSALIVRRLARRLETDLIHANSVRAGLIALMAAGHRPATIIHVHDCLPRTRAANLVRRMLRSASAVFANSQYTARNFCTDGRRAGVHVVYCPVDLDRFDPDSMARRECRRRLGLPPSAFALAMVAQLTPWKGQADAIDALVSVRRHQSGARLLMVGEAKFTSAAARYDTAAYRRSLRQAVSRLGLDDAVEFLGERPDLPEILGGTDIFLLPSWEEPFGICAIEAMAMGVPVIATNVGGPAEIISSGEDGLLLAPRQPARWAEAIGRLLAEPQTRARMGGRGRTTARRFSRRRFVERVLAGYDQTLRQARAS